MTATAIPNNSFGEGGSMLHTPTGTPVSPLFQHHVLRKPLGLDAVRLVGGSWWRWQQENRQISIPHAFGWLERDGSLDNLRRLAPGARDFPERRGLWFTDSDVYKAVEGAAWALAGGPSAELEALIATYAASIKGAQAPDGYVNSFVQAGLAQRWGDLARSHELYCIGHLIQAGIAHKRSTGRDDLLDVAIRAADCAVSEFGDGRNLLTDGHPGVEMALVELYRETRDGSYLRLARQFVDIRGYGRLGGDGPFGADYMQDAVPVREQRDVVGHAVRAVYLLCGVVDLYIETGEAKLLEAAVAQWTSMTATKTYLNGALGSRFDGEAFGDPFELPPDRAYGETCATIGSIMLSWRLLLATGEARFADSIERNLYNLFAASTSLSRDGFFYNNPAQRRTRRPTAPPDERPSRAEAPGTRPAWFECACCPPNIIRMIASLPAYLATTDHEGIQVHQYMPSSLRFAAPGGTATIAVNTNYPLDGSIAVRVEDTPGDPWTLSMRIPDWADRHSLTVNGHPRASGSIESGYLSVSRIWSAGDTVGLTLDIRPRITVLHPSVDAVRGTLALERGPLVYCLEDVDQAPGVDLDRVALNLDQTILETVEDDLLGQQVVTLRAQGSLRDLSRWSGTGWAPRDHQPPTTSLEIELVAIPYYLWANRGPSTMRIFIPADVTR